MGRWRGGGRWGEVGIGTDERSIESVEGGPSCIVPCHGVPYDTVPVIHRTVIYCTMEYYTALYRSVMSGTAPLRYTLTIYITL
jgi:hypothetical protein